MSNFLFTLGDLVSNDTSSSSSNPFYREFMKGKTSPPTTSAAFSTTAKGGKQPYDTYANTSVLSTSDVMMGTPLANSPAQTMNTQMSLVDSLLQGALGKVSGLLGIFDPLIPVDAFVSSAISSNKAGTDPGQGSANNPQGSAGSSGASGSSNPSSSGPTTNTAPGGIPAGMKQPPYQGVPVANFLNLALQQLGKPYVWASAGPSSFDCSGLVMWCLQQLKISFPHFTGSQYDTIVQAGLDIDPTEGVNMYGALLFIGSSASSPANDHVAISLGDGKTTVEAPHTGSYVSKLNSIGRGWTASGFIPGLDYTQVTYGQGISSLPVAPGSPGTSVAGNPRAQAS